MVSVATDRRPPRRPTRPPVHHLWSAVAQRRGEAPALVEVTGTTSYAEVERRANRLAHALLAAGLEREQAVPVLCGQSADVVVSILAVLKAGGCFVPLDPAVQEQRLVNILRRVEPKLALADATGADTLARGAAEAEQRLEVLTLDTVATADLSSDDPGVDWDPNGRAYVYFTSGSTGEPKGIVGRLRSIDHYLSWMLDTFEIDEDCRGAQLTSPAFDAFLRDAFTPLLAGGVLCIPPNRETVLDPAALLAWLDDHGVTFMSCVPSLLRGLLAQEAAPGRLASLRHLFLAGERLLPADVAGWRRSFGDGARMVNLYGATETTLTKLFYVLQPGDGERASLPIGRPMRGAEAMVLDRRRQPCPPGTAGEIWIRTPFRSHGYLGDAERTATVFRPNPFTDDPNDLLYQSGDYGRELESGDLEFLGRRDQMIKLRGVRVELGELENTVRRHPEVDDVVVVEHRTETGEQQLCAFYTSGEPIAEDALRGHCAESLAEALVPALFLRLDELPLTLTGKVDRKALPDPRALDRDRRGYTPPADALEESLAEIWGAVLGIPRIGRDDSFFALGGHSLLAIRALTRVAETCEVDVPLAELFEHPTLAQLATRVRQRQERGETVAPRLTPAPADAEIPQTSAQRRLWFLQQLDPDSTAYNVAVALRLRGDLDRGALLAALSQVVARHEALRTTFTRIDDRLVQEIAEPTPVEAEEVDLRSLSASERETEVTQRARQLASRPFDLRQGPLLRLLLLALDAEEHALVVVTHHIVCDEESMAILMREVVACYAARRDGGAADLADLPIQYRDYAHWRHHHVDEAAHLAHWVDRLQSAPEVLDLPLDHPRPRVPDHRGDRRPLALEPRLADALVARGRVLGATPFMTLLAVYAVVLARWTGQRDLVIGAPSAGRRQSETEGLIGFFVDTLVLRLRLEGRRTFEEILAVVRDTVLDAQAHPGVPFETLVEALQRGRELGHNPIFQVWLVLHERSQETLEVPGLTLEPLAVDGGGSKFDLTLQATLGTDGLEGDLEYNRGLFEPESIDRLARGLRRLVVALVEAPPETDVWQLPVVDDDALPALLGADPEPASGPALIDRFRQQVARRGSAVALVLDDPDGEAETVSYAELGARVERVAVALRRRGVRPGDRVGLLLERDLDLPVALLAVLAVGATYVPMDPATPGERIRFILTDAAVELLVVTPALLDLLGDTADRTTVSVADLDREGAASEGAPLADLAIDPQLPAYRIYTSGSTGRPKGVAVSQASVGALIDAGQRHYGFGDDDVWLLFHSYAFDVSVWELWGALAHGGRLCLVPLRVAQTPAALWGLVAEQGVTVLNQTPTVFRQVSAAALEPGAPVAERLRWVVFAGEAIDLPSLQPWLDPDVAVPCGPQRPRLINMYGITETTVHSTFREITRADAEAGRSVIGEPLASLRIVLLDRAGQLVPQGVTGEIAVGGAQVAQGYAGRPALTAERFVPDGVSGARGERLYRSGDLARRQHDGELVYLGRSDRQVKIRGFRIELGEIAATLEALPSVAQAVVVVDGEGEAKRLLAYAVPQAEILPDAATLRRALAESLPEYMVPAVFTALAEIPRTANGKLDVAALPTPERGTDDAGGGRRPQGAVEELVAGLFAELLQRDGVSAEASFFELGGHSLLATRLLHRIESSLGVRLPLIDVFEAPRPAELAARIETARRADSGLALPDLEILSRGDDGLAAAPSQKRLFTLQQIDPSSGAYNMPVLLEVHGALDLEALGRSVDTVVARHEILRTRFAVHGDVLRLFSAPPAENGGTLSLETDLSDLEREQGPEAALAAARREANALAWQAFDLTEGPLFRLAVWRLGDDRHLVLWVVHHLVFDGGSVELFVRELGSLYPALAAGEDPSLEPLAMQYADWAAWMERRTAGERGEALLDWWREQLAGLEPLELASDRPRPAVQGFRGLRVERSLPRATAEALEALGRQQDASPFMTVLACYLVLLGRLSGRSDIAIGSSASLRDNAASESLIGLCLNLVVLRAHLDTAPRFVDLLEQVRHTVLGVSLHQEMPYDRLMRALRPEHTTGGSPFVRLFFEWMDRPQGQLELEGLTLAPVEPEHPAAKFDLTFFGERRDDRLDLVFEADADLFDRATIEHFLDALVVLVEGVVAAPDTALTELPLLTPSAREELLRLGSHPDAEDRGLKTSVGELVHQRFAAQAARQADAVALVWGDETLRFGELAQRVWPLAHHLVDSGVGPESVVAVCFDRRPELVVAVLAVLAAGGAYLPIDPSLPGERIAGMLDDGDAVALLTHADLLLQLPTRRPSTLLLDGDDFDDETASGDDDLFAGWGDAADDTAAVASDSPTGPPEVEVGADNLAYVIFTSGSTGRPKGTLVTHGGLSNYLDWAIDAYGVEAGAPAAVLHSSIAFDLTVTSLLAGLAAGGSTTLAGEGEGLDPLVEALDGGPRHALLKLTPAHLDALAGLLGDGPTTLQPPGVLVVGGEALRHEQLSWWAERFPEQRVVNEYGPTETVVGCVVHDQRVEAEARGAVPIGGPIAQTRLHVVDRWLRPLPQGAVGELLIGGAGVARGYRGRPRLTAERFLPDPLATTPGARVYRSGDQVRFDAAGRLVYLGRGDQQVKVRGYRVELEEIEAVLAEHPAVRDAAVVARSTRAGHTRLEAYWVPSEEQGGQRSAEDEALRRHLELKLPDYMVPAYFESRDVLPLAASGKLDRRALEPHQDDAPAEEGAAPKDWVEETLVAIWQEVLQREGIGVDDDFIELGGDSILGIQVVARARAAGIGVMPRQIFEHRTIAQLAQIAELQTGETKAKPAAAPKATGTVDLLPIQRRFFDLDPVAPGHYNQGVFLACRQTLDPVPLAAAVGDLVRTHDSLRLVFEPPASNGDGSWTARYAELAADDFFARVDLTQADDPLGDLERATAEVQASFDLATGPLFRATLFDLGDQHPQHLQLVAHHLLVDGVSWRLLLEDLELAYAARVRDEVPALAAATTSLQAWGKRLAEHTRSGALDAELNHWAGDRWSGATALPIDRSDGDNTVESNAVVRVELGAEETHRLLEEVPTAALLSPEELMLTALARTLGEHTGGEKFLIDLEGHGREDLEWTRDLDVSRTVGWFAALYPVLLEASPHEPPSASLRRVKESLRAVPSGGVGYGLLRHGTVAGAARDRLRALPTPEVAFNYLGRLDRTLRADSPFEPARASAGPVRDPRQQRFYQLEIAAGVEDGRLSLLLAYSRNLHRKATIETLGEALGNQLRHLIDAAITGDPAVYAPSDFPEAELTDDQLDSILGEIDLG